MSRSEDGRLEVEYVTLSYGATKVTLHGKHGYALTLSPNTIEIRGEDHYSAVSRRKLELYLGPTLPYGGVYGDTVVEMAIELLWNRNPDLLLRTLKCIEEMRGTEATKRTLSIMCGFLFYGTPTASRYAIEVLPKLERRAATSRKLSESGVLRQAWRWFYEGRFPLVWELNGGNAVVVMKECDMRRDEVKVLGLEAHGSKLVSLSGYLRVVSAYTMFRLLDTHASHSSPFRVDLRYLATKSGGALELSEDPQDAHEVADEIRRALPSTEILAKPKLKSLLMVALLH